MPPFHPRSHVLALVLMATLAAPLAAGPPSFSPPDPSPRGLTAAWAWLSILWPDAACILGPTSLCRSDPVLPALGRPSRRGCWAEASGPCFSFAPEPLPKEGCGADPSGLCINPNPKPKTGCGVDPAHCRRAPASLARKLLSR